MSDLLVIAAFAAFLISFAAGRYRKYAALAGWTCIVLNLWSELPAFLQENNFLYPFLALLSLPFLAITADRLLRDDPVVLRLSRAAAIATIIWVPFALVPLLRDGLVSVVVTLVFSLVTNLGHHPQLYAWDVIAENGFYLQIIPGCTGITAIAMMLGIVSAGRLTAQQALPAFLLVVPVTFLLNLLRVAVVFIAVSDHWFAGWPDPTGTGDANFFWAHNVFAEGFALLFLVVLAWALVRIAPGLGIFVRDLVAIYRGRLRALVAAKDSI